MPVSSSGSTNNHKRNVVHWLTLILVISAFFTFLRANLVLSSSSCANTPQLEPMQTTASLPASFTKPSASILRHSRSSSTSSISSNGSTGSRRRQRSPPSPTPSACSLDSLPLDDDIPPLSLEPLETPEDKVEGLRLVADSVAQMHQRAFSTVLFHPLCLAGYAATLAGLYQAFGTKSDLGSCIIVACGVTMSYILLVRYLTSGYIRLAEQTNWWSWMTGGGGAEGAEDIVLGARFGGSLIGALVLRLEPNPSLVGKKKSRSTALKRGGRGVIRAWTTRMKFRGEGVGNDLLKAAIKVTKEKCGRDAEVGFAQEHANSTMVLPAMFNGSFRRDEILATKALQTAVSEWECTKRKRVLGDAPDA
ncbi:unnamed protein product [Clonostachys solani]|uniref:N-acetyltransferase domain-containing protein n=1 Tax=Clonostachys solani TaxID=160281 RepID=A0A9N9Z419_9HYPO|nr:unnamed protein product [Clonostachys solani]